LNRSQGAGAQKEHARKLQLPETKRINCRSRVRLEVSSRAFCGVIYERERGGRGINKFIVRRKGDI
jgi:hypothetical protein